MKRSLSVSAVVIALVLGLLLLSFEGGAIEKNGFDLEGISLPAEEIFHGGPPRDGIPSIDKPEFVAASRAGFLKPEDRVLGLDIDGVQRAYPIRILNWHEIVNDRINGKPVVITFCPLCGTGMVFRSNVAGKDLQFGVSGLLYNSDVLLYDRQTDSLWSQILSEAVSGELKGNKLDALPVSHTSWENWQKRHPETEVLAEQTGFSRNYSRTPYSGYDSNNSIFFPVSAESKRYHPKERVLGIEMGGKFKAYPFSELSRAEGDVLKDTFNGISVEVRFDAENRDGQIFSADGKPLKTVNGFWFAWFAFHPDTDVYTGT